MSAAETNGFLAAIRAGSGLANKVYLSDATSADGKPVTDSWYIIVHPGQANDEQSGLSGPYATSYPSHNVQAVGVTSVQCQMAMDKVDAALRPNGFGVSPVVTGRRTGPMRRDLIGYVDRDRDVSPPLYYQPAEYSFRSDPA